MDGGLAQTPAVGGLRSPQAVCTPISATGFISVLPPRRERADDVSATRLCLTRCSLETDLFRAVHIRLILVQSVVGLKGNGCKISLRSPIYLYFDSSDFAAIDHKAEVYPPEEIGRRGIRRLNRWGRMARSGKVNINVPAPLRRCPAAVVGGGEAIWVHVRCC